MLKVLDLWSYKFVDFRTDEDVGKSPGFSVIICHVRTVKSEYLVYIP